MCPVVLSLIEGCLQRDPEKRPTTEEITRQLGLVGMSFLDTEYQPVPCWVCVRACGGMFSALPTHTNCWPVALSLSIGCVCFWLFLWQAGELGEC